ncbi:MAG: hypothetical protein KC910_25720 [Candidatus Eremiobacteraeota bacterium]|nr:hypothetical protein [Candidatus Eremiobacteraeota bacterium]
MSRVLYYLIVVLLVSGCSGRQSADPVPPAASQPPQAQDQPAGESAKLKLSSGDGNQLYRFKIKEPHAKYKFYDSQDQELATLKVREDRVKVENNSDKELYKIKKKDHGMEIEDAAGKRLYRFAQGQGGWELSDDHQAVYRVVQQGDSTELRDAQGKLMARVSSREGGVDFKDEAGNLLMRFEGNADAGALLWLSAEGLEPALRSGLVVYYLEVN